MAEKSQWWDHYYVRYFVGSVFAVPLMLALSKTTPVKDLVGTLDQTKLLDATVLGAAGLAFCYIASAPVLLLHATRARRTAAKHAASTVSAWPRVFAIGTAALATALGVWIARASSTRCALDLWLSLTPLAALLLLEVTLIYRTPLASIVHFYRELAAHRAHQPTEETKQKRKEYIESYRDMREHGNALLILVMEGVLTMALLQAPSRGILLAMLVLWVLPASFVWFIATALEAHLGDIN